MIDENLEYLIKEVNNSPDKLMELGAAFIVLSASGNSDQINYYLEKVTKAVSVHMNGVLTRPLLQGIEGAASFYLTDYKKAKEQLLNALDNVLSNTPDDVEGFIRVLLGANYRSLGEIDLAVENLFAAVPLLDKKGFFRIYFAFAHYQLGEIYLAIGEFENAKTHYEVALSAIELETQSSANFRINDGLGLCYMHLQDFDKSLYYIERSLDVEGLSVAEQSRGLCDLGVLNINRNNLDVAIEQLKKSYDLRIKSNLEDAASTSLIQLGAACLKKNEAKKAVEYLKTAEEISSKFNALAKKIKILRLLGQGYSEMGKTEEAVSYFLKYDELNEQVRSEQKRKIFSLKNKQIEKQKLQLESQNVLLNETLNQLKEARNSKVSMFYSIVTAIVLVILSEAFLDPFIESYTYNVYLSFGVKIVIALLLKPMESLYERLLFNKAMKRVD